MVRFGFTYYHNNYITKDYLAIVEKYIKEGDNLRTLSSEGGIKKANGIEFSEVDERTISEELESFILNLEKLKMINKYLHVITTKLLLFLW